MDPYDSILDEIWEALIRLDRDGRVLRANLRASELFHCERGWIEGRSFTEIVDPSSADDLAVIAGDAFQGAKVTGKNLRLLPPRGEARVVEVSAWRVQAETESAGVFILLHDITEKQKMREELERYSGELYRRVEERTAALEESRECYVSLFEKAAVPLAWLDPAGVLQSANRAFYNLTRLEKTIAEGKLVFTDLLASELDRGRVSHYLDLHRRGYEAPGRLELKVNDARGRTLWTEWFIHFEPLTDQILVSVIDITEAKASEKALRASEERYRRLVETSPDAVTLTDLQGAIIMANRRGLELYGADREEEILGKSGFDLIAPHDRERAVHFMLETLRTGKVSEIEYEIARKDGTFYPASLSASVIRDDKNEPAAFIGVLRDITERKKAEAELERHRLHLEEQVKEKTAEVFEQRAFLLAVINSAADIVFVLDEKAEYVLANPAAEGFLTDSGFGLIGRRAGEKIHPDDRNKAGPALGRVLKGKSATLEIRVRDKDGEYRHLNIKVSPLEFKGKRHLLGVATDVTEIKKAELQLRESEERYRALFDRSRDCLFINDFQGRFIDANPAALELLGYSRQEIEEINYASLLDSSQVVEAMQALEEIARRGFQKDFREFRLRRKDGEFVVVETIGSLIHHEGKPFAVLGLARDVTARKKADAALRESEEKYRLLAENVSDVIWVSDLSLNLQYVSPSNERLSGFTAAEALHRGLDTIFTSDSAARALRVFLEELERLESGEGDPRQVHTLELEARHKTGEAIWVELKVSFILGREGKPTGLLGITRDITSRKTVEDALRKSEERYRLLAENATDVIWTTDLNFKVTYMTPSILRLTGYEVEEYKAMEFDRLFAPASLSLIRETFAEEMMLEQSGSADPGRTRTLELESIHKTRASIWCEMKMSWLRDKSGKPAGILGITRDIDARRAAEKALRESEERYRLLAENVTDVLWTADLSLKLQYLSPSNVRLTGYTPEEAKRRDPREVFTPESFERLFQAYSAELEREKRGEGDPNRTLTLELAENHKQGHVVWTEMKVSFIRDAGGRAVGFMGVTRDISARKKAEEELKEYQLRLEELVVEKTAGLRDSERKYKALFEENMDAVYLIDRRGKLIDVNRAAANLSGYPRDELAGKDVLDLYVSRERRAEFLRELQAKGVVRDFEVQLRKKDGTVLDCLVSSTVHRGPDGRLIGHQGIVRDITELKRSQQALRDSERRYRLLAENAYDVIMTFDLTPRPTYISPSVTLLLGYSVAEVMAMPPAGLISPESLAFVRKHLGRDGNKIRDLATSRGWSVNLDVGFLHKNGTVVPAEAKISVLRDQQGAMIGFMAVVRDATERDRAREQLQRSEAHFRSLIENALDVITVIDDMGVVRFESPSVANVLGYQPEELVGRPAFDFVHPDDAESAGRQFAEGLARKGGVARFEFRIKHKDGSWRLMEAVAKNMLANPDVKGIVVNSRDITERKLAGEALRQSEEKLAQAEKMAALGQMAAGVVHQVHNPLTAIGYYTQSLEKAKIPPAERDKIKKIAESAGRIQRLIAGLMSYASARAAAFEPVELNTLILQVLDSLAHEFEKRPGVKVKKSLSKKTGAISGSAEQFYHLLDNLIINALQALPKDKGEIKISTRAVKNGVVVEIQDNGVGIPEEDLPHIFNPFFTRRHGGGGAGLGLAIVSRVVNMHKGEISVDSKPGQGSRFKIVFPLPAGPGGD